MPSLYNYQNTYYFIYSVMPQDYSGQNLRGRSFRGQNLASANFSYADIHSADFNDTNLRGANFKGAKAGQQKRWAIFLVLVSWVLMGISGFFSVLACSFITYILFNTHKDYQSLYLIPGWIGLFILIIFFFITIRQGIQVGAIVVVIAFSIAIAITIVLVIAEAKATAIALTFAIAIAGLFVIAIAIAITFARAVAGAIAGVFAIAFSITGAAAGAIAIAIAFSIAIEEARGRATAALVLTSLRIGAGSVALFIAILLLGTYISWCAMKGDPKQSPIRNIAIAFATFGGTSFCNADLTNADFTQASLKSTNLYKANLTHTCFYQTKKLNLACPIEVSDALRAKWDTL